MGYPFLEAQTGFEPVDTGVADHCLTTWLLRHITLSIYSDNVFIITKIMFLSINLTVLSIQYILTLILYGVY